MQREGDPVAYWDAIAPSYDALYQTAWSQHEDRKTRNVLNREFKQSGGSRVLDIACGSGLGFRLLAEENSDIAYTGVDISQRMIESMIRRHPSVIGICANAIDGLKSLSNNSFDFVISINTAMSFPSDTSDIIHNINRVLSPGGRFALSFLNRKSLRRIITLKRGNSEAYKTRGDDVTIGAGVNAAVFTESDLMKMCESAGLSPSFAEYQSVLGGVYEGPLSTALEPVLARLFPARAHAIMITGHKAGGRP